MARNGTRKEAWSVHWQRLATVAQGRSSVLSFGRSIIARSVAALTDRHFGRSGFYLHAGSGTAESDALIAQLDREFIALDFVFEAAATARRQRSTYRCVVGDLRHLPFRADSIDGIWNVGVQEHFSPQENRVIFDEFLRVLKPHGKALVFWPGRYTPYMILKTFAERCVRLWNRDFSFFPDEINNARSRAHIRRELEEARFRVLEIALSWRDLFVFYSVVAEKPTGRAPSR
jgi:SAM-dependent methyltransferase